MTEDGFKYSNSTAPGTYYTITNSAWLVPYDDPYFSVVVENKLRYLKFVNSFLPPSSLEPNILSILARAVNCLELGFSVFQPCLKAIHRLSLSPVAAMLLCYTILAISALQLLAMA